MIVRFLSSTRVRILSVPLTGIQTETRDQRVEIGVDRFVFANEIVLHQTRMTETGIRIPVHVVLRRIHHDMFHEMGEAGNLRCA